MSRPRECPVCVEHRRDEYALEIHNLRCSAFGERAGEWFPPSSLSQHEQDAVIRRWQSRKIGAL